MPPTDELIRISDGTACAAWGGDYFKGVYHYNLLSHYEDSRHFRHRTTKDRRDIENRKIKFVGGSEALKNIEENPDGVILRENADKLRGPRKNSRFIKGCFR